MKILAFSDLHSDKDKLKKLIRKIEAEDPDVIISSGDTSNFGRNLNGIISEIKKTKRLLLIIPGNHESEGEIKKFSDNKQIINLHKKSYGINNVIFFGYGSGGFSRKEKEFELVSEKFMKTIKKDLKIILITHSPPYGTKIDFIPGF